MGQKSPRGVVRPRPFGAQDMCRHAAVEVRSVDGELVAQLCTACDKQLEPDWHPSRVAFPHELPSFFRDVAVTRRARE